MGERIGTYSRESKETKIWVKVNIDGTGLSNVKTAIGFFDHMLTLMAFQSKIDLEVMAEGDLYIDGHHTVEDVGITLGKAISEALGDKSKAARYGFTMTPMDEALASVTLDISGRPYLFFNCPFNSPLVGEFDVQLTEEFFRALTLHCGITAHIDLIRGRNEHHKIEAIFKGFGRALAQCLKLIDGISSTKGTID